MPRRKAPTTSRRRLQTPRRLPKWDFNQPQWLLTLEIWAFNMGGEAAECRIDRQWWSPRSSVLICSVFDLVGGFKHNNLRWAKINNVFVRSNTYEQNLGSWVRDDLRWSSTFCNLTTTTATTATTTTTKTKTKWVISDLFFCSGTGVEPWPGWSDGSQDLGRWLGPSPWGFLLGQQLWWCACRRGSGWGNNQSGTFLVHLAMGRSLTMTMISISIMVIRNTNCIKLLGYGTIGLYKQWEREDNE